MAYHMPRVVHWIQNFNVYPFPTFNIRQVVHPPLAEYIILNVQILSKGDYFANLVQYFSMLGSLAVVSLFAKEFELDYKGQFFSALFALSIPMGLFQSTTTQTDYVASFFLLCFIYFAYLSIHRKDNFFNNVFLMTCSLFLGGFTKFTVLIFAFPFCIGFGSLYLKKFPLKKILIIATLMVIVAGFIFLPFVLRNQKYFESPLGPRNLTNEMKNEKLSFISMFSNSSKNITDILALPISPYNKLLQIGIERIHHTLGITPDEPSNNFLKEKYKVCFFFNEDYTGSPLHFISFILTGLILFKMRDKNINTFIFFYLCIVMGFLFYSFIFKWQPWGNRLLLPLMLTSTIISGIVIYKVLLQKELIIHLLTLLLLIYCLFPVYFNPGKLMIPSIVGLLRTTLKKPNKILYLDKVKKIPTRYRKRILGFYDSTEVCYKIKPTLSNIDLRKVYEISDSAGVYNDERKTVFKLSRYERYFIYQPFLYSKYEKLINSINQSGDEIAIGTDSITFEYQLWVLCKKKFEDKFNIGYVGKTNQTGPFCNQFLRKDYFSIVESNSDFLLHKQAK